MPKHAVNVTEQNRIRKLFLAGNSAEAIAAHMNVDLPVVEAWHPDNVDRMKARNRELEREEAGRQAEADTAAAEEEARRQKASERAKKAAATRKANADAKRQAAKDADRKLAEEREEAQRQAAEIRNSVQE